MRKTILKLLALGLFGVLVAACSLSADEANEENEITPEPVLTVEATEEPTEIAPAVTEQADEDSVQGETGNTIVSNPVVGEGGGTSGNTTGGNTSRGGTTGRTGGNNNANGVVINSPNSLPPNTCGVYSADGDAINIRSGPGLNYGVIGTLITPAPYASAYNGWYQILMPNNATGWVSGSVTILAGPCGQAGNPGGGVHQGGIGNNYPIQNAGNPPAGMCAIVNTSTTPIPVYTQPTGFSGQNPVAALITWAEAMEIHSTGTVRIIIRAGETGWINANGLILAGNCSNIINGPALPGIGMTGTPPADSCALVHPGSTAQIVLYQGQSTSTAALGLMNNWLPVTLVSGEWYQVRLPDNRLAWVKGNVLNNSPGLTDGCHATDPDVLPHVGNFGTPADDVCHVRFTNSPGTPYIHAQPSQDGVQIAIMETDSWLVMTDVINSGWYQVAWSANGQGFQGYIRQEFVTTFNCNDGDYDDLPVHSDPGSPPTNTCVAVHPGGTAIVPIHPNPNPQSEPLMVLGNWAEVVFSNEGWLQVMLGPNETGWIEFERVNLIGTCAP